MYVPFGIIPALPTPFKEDCSIDFDSLKKLINEVIDAGVHGILIGGSTGEYTLLSMEERKSIIKVACEVANGRVPIMAGTSCHRTEDTISLSKFSAEVGADCVLAVPPYYLKTSRQGIIDYYKEVAVNSNIGVVIYHYPGATNVLLDPALILELSQLDGIVGLKNTTDQDHTCKVINLTKDITNFAILSGYQHLILPTLSVGGDGAICIIPSLIPKEIVQLYDLVVKENNVKEAAQLNKKLMPLYDCMDAEFFPGPIKAGLHILGISGETVRSPIVPATEELKEKIKVELTKLGYKVEMTI